MAHIKLGELLVRTGYLQEQGLRQALEEQQKWGGRLGRILVEMKLVSEDVVLKALCKQLGYRRANLAQPQVPPAVLQRLDPAQCAAQHVCPERLEAGALHVAMEDHTQIAVLDDIRTRTGLRIETTLATDKEISAGLAILFPGHAAVPSQGQGSVRYLETSDFKGAAQAMAAEDARRASSEKFLDSEDFSKAAAQVAEPPAQPEGSLRYLKTEDFGSAAKQVRASEGPSEPRGNMRYLGTEDFGAAAQQVQAEPEAAETPQGNMRYLGTDDFSEAAAELRAEEDAEPEEPRGNMRYLGTEDFGEAARRIRDEEGKDEG